VRPFLDDTIVAIATPIGEAGLGVVRLSGPASRDIASRLFSLPLTSAAGHTLHHGWLVRGDVRLDEAVAAVFRAPKSYTGEDVIEFSCHGSPAVLRTLLDWCQAEGARLARPGEFTQRAFLSGKLDLAQAEAVASLIAARSRRAAAAAATQLAGGLSARVKSLRGDLIAALADIEANLDFVEEDIPNVSRARMTATLDALAAGLASLLATGPRGRLLREGARVAMAGRPNVGKSSLFNALLAEERAIVSDLPGTTRDVLEERVQWDGFPITLLDTAGLRAGGDAVEAIGAERARRTHDRADVLLLVVDASEGLSAEDASIAAGLAGPVIVALNKTDRGDRVGKNTAALGGRPCVRTSATTGAGLDDLRGAVLAALAANGGDVESGAVITNERHAERLTAAAARLAAARQAVAGGRSEEAVAADLRAAADELGAITGQDVGDDVLDSVFRRFCIGK
jgi:tRNA modification GTPase